MNVYKYAHVRMHAGDAQNPISNLLLVRIMLASKQKCINNFDTPYLRNKKSYKALFFFNFQEKVRTLQWLSCICKKTSLYPIEYVNYVIFWRRNVPLF